MNKSKDSNQYLKDFYVLAVIIGLLSSTKLELDQILILQKGDLTALENEVIVLVNDENIVISDELSVHCLKKLLAYKIFEPENNYMLLS